MMDHKITSSDSEDVEHENRFGPKEDNNVPRLSQRKIEKKRKKLKMGIVYLSTIPPFMNVTKITEIMNRYGEVGRVFLQPAKSKKTGNKPAKHFTEGWVEFLSKRVAKEVAANLNNTMIGGRKKNRYYDYIWNIKYLPRFKWVHLNERLEYERAVLKQRLRAESEQAKREASHFAHTVEQGERLKKSSKGFKPQSNDKDEKPHHKNIYKQRKTDEEIKKIRSKNYEETSKENRVSFLKSLF